MTFGNPPKAFSKKALTIDEQLDLLISRGLIIENKEKAKFYLSKVSYYRLSIYMRYYQNDKVNHKFKEGTSFNKVFRLYRFDRKLRLILFEAIEKVENAIKAKIINEMSVAYGPHWYLEREYFDKLFKHEEFLIEIKNSCKEENETFIKHYNNNYNQPELPPCWMALEILSFGKISKMFESLAAPPVRGIICDHFNTQHRFLLSWLHSFTWIRNVAAHHARLWDRVIPHEPKFPQREKNKFLKNEDFPKNRLYATLCCLQRTLEYVENKPVFKRKLLKHLSAFPEINIKAMGFPENWKEELLWKLPSEPNEGNETVVNIMN